MSWYSTGFSRTEMAQKEAELNRSMVTHKGPPRFFMSAGQSKDVVFIDDRAFEMDEHNIRINGKWGNHFTCIGIKNGCPFCIAGYRAYYTCLFTVVDMTGWVDRKGNVKDKNTIALFPAKADVAATIKHYKESRPDKSLIGCQYKLFRASKTDAVTGSNFTFVQRYNPQSVLAKHQPINYEQLYGPLSIDQANAVLRSIKAQNDGFGAPVQQPSAQTQPQGSSGFQPANESHASPQGHQSIEPAPNNEIPF